MNEEKRNKIKRMIRQITIKSLFYGENEMQKSKTKSKKLISVKVFKGETLATAPIYLDKDDSADIDIKIQVKIDDVAYKTLTDSLNPTYTYKYPYKVEITAVKTKKRDKKCRNILK